MKFHARCNAKLSSYTFILNTT